MQNSFCSCDSAAVEQERDISCNDNYIKKKCCMKTIKQMQIKRETRRRKSPSVLQMAFEQYSMFRKMQREKESSVLIIFNVINKHVIIMAFFA